MTTHKKNRIKALADYLDALPDDVAINDFLTQVGLLMGRADYLKKLSLRNIVQGSRTASADLTLAIAEATNWAVTPHMIRPSTFRNPHDGIPLSVFRVKPLQTDNVILNILQQQKTCEKQRKSTR